MAQGRQPHKILVVDDEPDVEPLVLQRMRRNIRSGQYSFVFASNGVAALERLRREPDIDMVLSDINMPQMDGLTLLQQIPKVDPNIRCVIVSAYGDMDNIRTAMNRGAFDFVTDGVTEAMNAAHEEFGVERLREIFASGAPGESMRTSQAVFDAVRAFAGDTPQSDDVTCLTLCRGEFGS